MWLIEDLFAVAVLVLVALSVAAGVEALMPWLPVVVAAAGLTHVVVVPRLRHRRYRWELHPEELDLLRGVLRVTRTIVPVTRIQHVSVERTAWTSVFDVVRLSIHTAAGETTIPGLAPAQADELRDRILALLRTPDDL